ncbi:acyl-CoA thioesterase [Anaerobacillus sp. MEB173]|uniref:acyl-CoA thioesterase n=1 Tax=Anaerobacillus sp. MEB173 TaxID=3383345 RepID=UPI003F91EDA1
MKNEVTITTRMCETDALGHINNVSYFTYLEQARVEFFKGLGAKMDTNDFKFILASTKYDFINQAYFDQKLKITTTVTRVGTKSFGLEHDIVDFQTEQLIGKGEETIVVFNFEKQKSENIDQRLRSKLNNYIV